MNMIISYKTLRKLIGILAMAFPFILILCGQFEKLGMIQLSLSEYYWTNCRILFSGMLTTFGLFLLCYRGYSPSDNIITTISGIAMLMVASFACESVMIIPPALPRDFLFSFLSAKTNEIVHVSTAVVAFGSMGAMSFFQFTKGAQNPSKKKLQRNFIYRICGVVIFVAMIGMLLVNIIPGARAATDPFRLFFWLESIILVAFGFSWLVKGEGLLKG